MRLHSVSDFYPTVTLTASSPRLRLNFGKTPFFFDFERYVQVELAALLQAIELEPISRECVARLVLDYTRLHGYRKTADSLERFIDQQQATKIKPIPIKTAKPVAPRSHRPLTRKSLDNIQSNEKLYKSRLDFRFVTSPLQDQGLSSAKKPRKTAEISSVTSDPTCAAQRGLIRSLLLAGKLAEAEKLAEVCFRGVLAQPGIGLQLQALRFVQLCVIDPLAALALAKTNFSGDKRELPFFYKGPDRSILSAPVKVGRPQ